MIAFFQTGLEDWFWQIFVLYPDDMTALSYSPDTQKRQELVATKVDCCHLTYYYFSQTAAYEHPASDTEDLFDTTLNNTATSTCSISEIFADKC